MWVRISDGSLLDIDTGARIYAQLHGSTVSVKHSTPDGGSPTTLARPTTMEEAQKIVQDIWKAMEGRRLCLCSIEEMEVEDEVQEESDG